MTTKHTPGPWNYYEPLGTITGGKDNLVGVASVFKSYSNSPAPETCDANARLIAAAPDLLKALRQILDSFPRDCGGHAGAFVRCTARAAIDKAEGRKDG